RHVGPAAPDRTQSARPAPSPRRRKPARRPPRLPQPGKSFLLLCGAEAAASLGSAPPRACRWAQAEPRPLLPSVSSLTARPCAPAPAAAVPPRPPRREAGVGAGRRLRTPARPRALRAGKRASPREDPPGVGNMAASSRAQVLRLYRALLRESQRFSSYNYRTYAIRRIRDAFRENKNIKDSEKIEELVNKAKANLEVIHRQVTIGQLYSTQKLVIESPENT
uniref:Complex 1 LYR protein domain-containing protein n=6 Tax=Neoaves TaxID=3078114 RepID=A0A8C6JHU7_MELUD